MKPLPLNESDRGNTPDTPSNSRSGTPPRLRRRRRKPYLPSTNHEPSTRSVLQMSSMQTTICIRSLTTSQAPRRRWSKRHRNDGARGHRSTTRIPPPPRHPCLNRLISRSIPNHRTDGLVRKGSEEYLFSIVIVAAEAKAMNNLKPRLHMSKNDPHTWIRRPPSPPMTEVAGGGEPPENGVGRSASGGG